MDGYRRAACIALLTMTCLAALAASGTTAARAATATATVPTLGSTTFAQQQQIPLPGFGAVRPQEISYDGDPTSFVSHIHWNSWGASHAIGHGRADWVWPGWCVACGSVELPATVVAFDEGSCDGQLAYRKVEWFFPTRGMTFDTRLQQSRDCTVPTSPRYHAPPHGKCAPVTDTAGRTGQISRYGYGLDCATARRFVTALRPERYLDRSARFETQGWWCGTDPTPDSPQSISCSRGDFDEVFFNLSPGGE